MPQIFSDKKKSSPLAIYPLSYSRGKGLAPSHLGEGWDGGKNVFKKPK